MKQIEDICFVGSVQPAGWTHPAEITFRIKDKVLSAEYGRSFAQDYYVAHIIKYAGGPDLDGTMIMIRCLDLGGCKWIGYNP